MVWFTADVFIEYQRTRRQYRHQRRRAGAERLSPFCYLSPSRQGAEGTENNDEATAIREFEYIHQQVPDNIPLTLYLAEAYRHFGHDARARLLLEDQLKRHPGDARLERSLAAIPVEVKSVTTVEELLAQQKRAMLRRPCVVAVKSGRMPCGWHNYLSPERN